MDRFTSVPEILHCEESNDNWGSWQEIPFRADRLPGRAFTVLQHEVKYNAAMQRQKISRCFLGMLLLVVTSGELHAQTGPAAKAPRQLPNGKLLGDAPGRPASDKQFSHGGSGFTGRAVCGAAAQRFWRLHLGEKQSLTVLNLETNELRDFPDERLEAKQSKRTFWGWLSA